MVPRQLHLHIFCSDEIGNTPPCIPKDSRGPENSPLVFSRFQYFIVESKSWEKSIFLVHNEKPEARGGS